MDILGLEVVVNAELVALGEASLGTEVVVAKVVAVAGRLVGGRSVSTLFLPKKGAQAYQERESERVVGRRGAAVSRPVKVGRIPVGTASAESRQGDAEHELVRDGHVVLARDKSLGREGGDGGSQAGDGSDKLHDGQAVGRRTCQQEVRD